MNRILRCVAIGYDVPYLHMGASALLSLAFIVVEVNDYAPLAADVSQARMEVCVAHVLDLSSLFGSDKSTLVIVMQTTISTSTR